MGFFKKTAVFLFALGAAVAEAGYTPRPDSLVLYYPFDEASGEIAFCSAGSGNEGRISGRVGRVDGVTGGALEFSGDDYLESDNVFDNLEELTVSFWIYQPASDERGMLVLGNSRDHGLGSAGFKFLKRDGSPAGNLEFRVSDGEAGRIARTNSLPVDEWAHVAGVLGAGRMELYVNGELQSASPGAPGTGASGSPLRIGLNRRGSEGALSGMRIDELKIWEASLEGSEINRLYTFRRMDFSSPELVSEVISGDRREAKASWWGFDPEDSTEYLQAAIDSGARKLIVERMDSDWVVGPIRVASDIEMVFRDGVVVRSRKGAFGRNDRLFDILSKENVVMRGEGKVVLKMDGESTYPHYHRPGQRHIIRIFGSRNVLVQNLTVEDSGGDGVYVGYSPSTPVAEDITIDRVISRNNPRQAISVTGATNLTLKDSVFNDTGGAAPQCGIDIEPNYPSGSVVNFKAVNCDFNGNAFAGIIIAMPRLDETSEPVTISFLNCRIRDNNTGISVHNTGSGTPAGPGRIEFIGCEVSGTVNSSLSISQHMVENMEVIFRNILVDNRDSRFEAFRISSGRPENIHGIRIEGLTVIDDRDRPPINFISRFGNGLVGAVVRDVKTVRSDGTEIPFDSERFIAESAPDPAAREFMTLPLDMKELRPAGDKGTIAGGGIRYREKTDFLQYAEPGQEIGIRFTNRPVHRFESPPYRNPLEVRVYNPDGMMIDDFGIPFDESVEYRLLGGEPGVYRFAVDARMQTVTVESGAPGQGVAASETLYILGCTGRLYFHVPEGAEDIRIDAGGSPREASTVYLLDPAGNEVDSGIRMEGSKILSHRRADASRGEVWSIRFTASKLYLRIGAPLVPVFSSAPENILVPE